MSVLFYFAGIAGTWAIASGRNILAPGDNNELYLITRRSSDVRISPKFTMLRNHARLLSHQQVTEKVHAGRSVVGEMTADPRSCSCPAWFLIVVSLWPLDVFGSSHAANHHGRYHLPKWRRC